MDYGSSINFTYARDLSITFFARKLDLSLPTILEAKRIELLSDDSSVLLYDNLIESIPALLLDYIGLRDRLFPEAEKLFPTVDGKQYYPINFHKRMRKILTEAGTKTLPTNPKKLTNDQYQALLNMRFQIQRQRYQMFLAVTLCTFLGMRPSEVAKLEKRDIDFSTRLLLLRDTKSQGDQPIPMLSFMVEPLERYTLHLTDSLSPLFINSQGAKWECRDVADAIARWGDERDMKNLTPRKLRASLGATLSRLNIEPALAAIVLRHKDAATTLRYYNERELYEARGCLEGMEQILTAKASNEFIRDFMHMYTPVGRKQ
jgi:integrase